MNTETDRNRGRDPQDTSRIEEWLNRTADAMLVGVEEIIRSFRELADSIARRLDRFACR